MESPKDLNEGNDVKKIAEQYYLYPSTIFASRDNFNILTVLGSCVSICLWDSYASIGGMNHYMLPLWNGDGLASPKYGNIACEKLLEKMFSLGAKKVNIRAKVFGGGEVIETNIKQFNIGERNIHFALSFLSDYNIPIISKSYGGNLGRKIIFNTNTGEVLHKFIDKTKF